MRGYFGVGGEGLSKSVNAGNLFRTAHAFGASFVFTVASPLALRDLTHGDTSAAWEHLPCYRHDSPSELVLPRGCRIVGIELVDGAVELPSFRHPLNAAYVFGRERGSLSAEMQARCDHLVQIPTRFCVNVAAAGAIVLYDRTLNFGGFAARGFRPGGPPGGPAPSARHGAQKVRTGKA